MCETICCPYCEVDQKANLDEGYEDSERMLHECINCNKVFTYIISISAFCSDESIAPCLNGGDHKYKDVIYTSKGRYKVYKRCIYCDDAVHIYNETSEIDLGDSQIK